MNLPFYDFHTHNPEPIPGVVKMVNIEPGAPSPERDGIFYSSGVHPWRTAEVFNPALLRKMLPQLTAIGETGLDRLRGAPLAQQIEIFEQHLKYQKPLIIHNVRCTAEILQRLPNPERTLWHRAPTKPSTLRQIIATGSTVSFGKKQLQHLNPDLVPLNLLGLETDDSDGLNPLAHNARADLRNQNYVSDSAIAEVYQDATELWQIPLDQLKQQLQINFTNLYLKPHERF